MVSSEEPRQKFTSIRFRECSNLIEEVQTTLFLETRSRFNHQNLCSVNRMNMLGDLNAA